MDDFKDLNLDRTLLESRIEDIAKEILGDSVKVKKEGQGHQAKSHMFIFSTSEKECKLLFYYNVRGTTTINYKVGKEQELSKDLAEKLTEIALIDARDSFSITISDFAYFDELISYLLEDGKSKIMEEKQETGYLMLKLQGTQGDTLTIKKYTNGTLQLQGKPIYLYKEALYFLVELCDSENIIKAQENFHRISIVKDGIDYEYAALLKNSHNFLGDTLKRIILPSFTLKKIDIELTDYSLFVFPALRGLEGYIKQIFKSKGIVVSKEGVGAYFTQSYPNYTLSLDARNKINCTATTSVLEEAYHYFHLRRNSLFHVDGMIEPTRIIGTKIQAEKLIDDAINLIETSYSRLPCP